MKLLNNVKRENKWNLRTNKKQTAVINVFLERKKTLLVHFVCSNNSSRPGPFLASSVFSANALTPSANSTDLKRKGGLLAVYDKETQNTAQIKKSKVKSKLPLVRPTSKVREKRPGNEAVMNPVIA